jgi:hypothetical protein
LEWIRPLADGDPCTTVAAARVKFLRARLCGADRDWSSP